MDEGHLDIVEQPLKAILFQHRLEHLEQLTHDVIALVGVPQVAHGIELLMEIDLGEYLQRMALFRFDKVMGDHHVKEGSLRGNAFFSQPCEDGLQVITHFDDFRILNLGTMRFPAEFILGKNERVESGEWRVESGKFSVFHFPLSTFHYPIVSHKPLLERPELQFVEQLEQCRDVWFVEFQFLGVEFHWCVEHNGGEMFRHQALFGKVAYVFLLFSFEFVGMGNHFFHAAIFSNQKGGVLFADARDAWDVVGGVAPEPEDIYHLGRLGNSVFLTDFLWTDHLCRGAELGGFINKHLVGDQLSEVFIGGHHVSDEAFLFRFA